MQPHPWAPTALKPHNRAFKRGILIWCISRSFKVTSKSANEKSDLHAPLKMGVLLHKMASVCKQALMTVFKSVNTGHAATRTHATTWIIGLPLCHWATEEIITINYNYFLCLWHKNYKSNIYLPSLPVCPFFDFSTNSYLNWGNLYQVNL